MLAIVSPAKKLDFSALAKPLPHSLPQFTDQTQSLVKTVDWVILKFTQDTRALEQELAQA